jgi:UDP-glucose 4-epimerase
MKTVLFLGGNGFLGKNVIDWYERFVANTQSEAIQFIVTGRSDSPVAQSQTSRVTYFQVDFSNTAALRHIFEQRDIAEVFHFVSATVPSNPNQNISRDIHTNLLGTIGLLELMAEFKVERLTYISSGGAIYGDVAKGSAQEEDFNVPNNSYGIVKLTIEKYIHLFNKLYGIDYLILRVSNPFGAWHSNEKNGLINIAVRRGLSGQPVTVWGDGLQTKDYIFAEDFARIFWELHRKNIKNRILNIGSGQLYSILDILANIKKIIPALTWTFEEAKSFDTKKVAFSLDSLRKIMTIENTDFQEALQKTVDWEGQHLQKR